jgi:Tfp pilus assembly protein PilN
MIQFNLLPNIKMEYIRARRQKQLVSFISFIVAATAVALMVLMFSYVQIAQKKHLSDLNKDIKKYNDEIKSIPDFDKVLTIQNQLKSIPSLLEARPVASRLFTYIGQFTPSNININKFKVDFDTNTMAISGTADKLESINKFVDTFKFTQYQAADSDGSDKKGAFSDVVLSTFARDDKGATFQVTLTYDPLIFDGTKNMKLVVPDTITTRSQTEQPTQLFTGTTEENR